MQRSVVVGGLLISASLFLALLFNCSATRSPEKDDATVLKPRPAAVPVLHEARAPGSSRLGGRGGRSRLHPA